MKTLTCLVLGLLMSASATAATASQNKAEFCADRENAEYYRKKPFFRINTDEV